jgi:hypothetical protein
MLSILHREMRIASRRRWTFWSRVVTSVVAFASGFFLVLLSNYADGSYVFTALVFVSFWFCLIQGVRRAAASISDEKRDGTLGLLFLTDLPTIDIIAGKLFAVAVPLVQPLLAFLPVLAISVLLGGTTGGEIFRAGLVLASILLFSISAGLFVSSFSRGEETGQSTIFVLLAILAVPRLVALLGFFKLRYLSPWSAYAAIPDPGYRVSGEEFWYSLLFANLLSAVLLMGAGFFLKRRWEDQPITQEKPTELVSLKKRITNVRRAAILDRNPGEWLAARHSMGSMTRWLFVGLIFALCVLAVVCSKVSWTGGQGTGAVILSLAALFILIRLASQASYPLAEARRSGAIEMMLSTPLNPNCLLTGQLAALRNQFFPPLGMILIASVFLVSKEDVKELLEWLAGLAITWGMLALVTVTIAAFGMWMGLREKSPNKAFFKTILFTLLPLILGPCLWFVIVPAYIILFLVSIAFLTGNNYRRLLRNDKDFIELTPVRLPRSYDVPPVIKT